MRTTSSAESLHSTYNRSFPNHPHIFKFVDCLKMHAGVKANTMWSFESNGAADGQLKRKSKIDREREERITYFSALLDFGRISVKEFLNAMASKATLPLKRYNVSRNDL